MMMVMMIVMRKDKEEEEIGEDKIPRRERMERDQ